MSLLGGAELNPDLDAFVDQGLSVYRRVAKAVFVYCGDRTLAEDSAQEALVRAWELVESGQPPRSLEAWTMTVAFNWCRSQLRRESTGARVVERLTSRVGTDDRLLIVTDPSDTGTDPIRAELSDAVQTAVLALPDRQRQVVALHYLADMDVASTAEVCGISQGAAKNALFNARTTLAETLRSTRGGVDDDT